MGAGSQNLGGEWLHGEVVRLSLRKHPPQMRIWLPGLLNRGQSDRGGTASCMLESATSTEAVEGT